MPYVKFGVYGVDLSFLHTKMWYAVKAITQILGNSWNITSTKEGTHLNWSKHYQGKAIDIGLPYTNNNSNHDVVEQLQDKLGNDFFVLLESTHIHIQYNGD